MSESTIVYRGKVKPLSYGTEKSEGYIVVAQETTTEGEEVSIQDEVGNTAMHLSGIDVKHTRSASVIPQVGVVEPKIGDTITIGTNFNFILKSLKKSKSNKDVERWDMSGTAYDALEMTPLT